MSEQNNTNDTQPLGTEPVKPQATRKTSAVPLRKETVRVTLKSTPAGAKKPEAPRPPAPRAPMPTAMTKDSAPQGAPAPPAHNPDIPDVTSAVPLKQETMRVTLKADPPKAGAPSPAAPAPSAPAPAAPAPKAAPAPAPTVPLNTSPAATGQPTVALATHSLPKATVQLQQTQQLGAPASPQGGATFQQATEDDSETSGDSTLLTALAITAFVFSLLLLFMQVKRAGVWVNAHEGGSYGAIFSASE